MHYLTETDLTWIVNRLPSALRGLCQERGLFIAGGAIRAIIAGETVNDYDIFGPGPEALESAANALKEAYVGARIFKTDNAITVLCPPRTPVQFITRWSFGNLEDCVRSFDFTVCQAGIQYMPAGRRWSSKCSDKFYSDLAARRLVYTAPNRHEDAGGSLMRVRKYLARGYNIQAESLGSVIARLLSGCETKFNHMDEFGKARVLSGLLREVDPLQIVDGVETVHACALEVETA